MYAGLHKHKELDTPGLLRRTLGESAVLLIVLLVLLLMCMLLFNTGATPAE